MANSKTPKPRPAVQRILDFLKTGLKPLMHPGGPEPESVGYTDTRPPIYYDYHMPPTFQLKKMEYSPEFTSQLANDLARELGERSGLDDDSLEHIDAYIEMMSFWVQKMVVKKARSELSVKLTQYGMHQVSCSVATLSCFNIDSKELKKLPSVFGIVDGSGANTRADMLIGCLPDMDDDEEPWMGLWDSLIAPYDLREPYFRVLYPEEYKNILAGNPRVILGIYIILWCLHKRYIATFWPENDCDGCTKFRKSHEAADAVDTEDEAAPSQNADSAEETLGNSRHKLQDPPLDAPGREAEADTNFSKLKKEIKRVCALATDYDKAYNIPDAQRTVRDIPPAKSGEGRKGSQKRHEEGPADDALKKFKLNLEAAMIRASGRGELNLPESMKDGLFKWVLNAAFMLIQVWSQMVRHNSTVSRLTCHNVGVVLARHRKTGTLEVSQCIEYKDAPLLQATALTVYAYNDAIERYDAHIAARKPLWEQDPFRGETQQAQAAAEKADKPEDKDDKDDSDDSDDDDGPGLQNKSGSGGGGGGGGSGGPETGGGGGGGGDGPEQDRLGKRRQSDRLKERDAKRPKNHGDLNINNVHLAFRAPRQHLWSKGFSHFARVGNTASASFPGTLVAVSAQTFSDQQRRVSAGSTQSSRSTDSTQTSAQSLFSDSPSVPTSPATTGSFTDASSRENSPWPEKKLGERQTGLDDSTPATVSDAGIIIHEMVKESAGGIVWSGEMILEDNVDDVDTIPIVVKMSITRDTLDGDTSDAEKRKLHHEGEVYEFLSGKLGKKLAVISPGFNGIFEDRIGSVALVLGNGGAALKSFDDCERQKREQLFTKAVEMHLAGVRHNDLEPRNIVQDADGELRIIDFHIAEIDHGCSGMCDELVNFRQALKLGPL